MKALKSCNINTEVLLEKDYNELTTYTLRTGAVPQYTLGYGSCSYIMFKPAYLDNSINEFRNIRLKSITLQTRPSGGTTYNELYLRLKKSHSDSSFIGVSKPTYWQGSGSIFVKFEFENLVDIANPNDMYCIDFSETINGQAIVSFGLSFYTLSQYEALGDEQFAANNRCYIAANNGTMYGWFRPSLSIEYFASENERIGAPIYDINMPRINKSADVYDKIWCNIVSNDQANIRQIGFYPRCFNMQSNDAITSITLTTRQSSQTAINNMKLRIKSAISTNASVVIGESAVTTWPAETNKDVTFVFNTPVTLPNKDKMYFVDFVDSSENVISFGLTTYNVGTKFSYDCFIVLVPSGSNNVIYNNAVPKMCIQYNGVQLDGCKLATKSNTILKNDTVNYFEFDENAISVASMNMQMSNSIYKSDFILDVKNPPLTGNEFNSTSSYAINTIVIKDNFQWKLSVENYEANDWNEALWEKLPYPQISLSNDIDVNVGIFVQENQVLSNLLTFAPGENAEIKLEQTAFTKIVNSNKLPIYKITKQIFEVGNH